MKRFLVILGLTAVVWLGVSMSESMDYTVPVKIRYVGYDTVRYALADADTVLPMRITSSGYVAFLMGQMETSPEVQVSIKGNSLQSAIGTDSLYAAVRQSVTGIKDVSCSIDSLRVTLVERGSKTFRPTLDAVSFEFAERYGLYGEPVVTPAEVVLYGPEEVLSAIGSLPVATTTVSGISKSQSYTLPLEPVWEQYGDVRPSCTEVQVFVPVESFVERTYKVPIMVDGADSSVAVHVYPPEATLHMWVAQRDLHREPELTAALIAAQVHALPEIVDHSIELCLLLGAFGRRTALTVSLSCSDKICLSGTADQCDRTGSALAALPVGCAAEA